ncbi:MAG: hypothetical protein HYX53_11725 [Chloroflexi bacterium]|nr:hypothetical protein [Chloroflexota bacterium]
MQFGAERPVPGALRWILAADAVFEFGAAAAMAVFAGQFARWLATAPAVFYVLAAAFAVAGGAITWLASRSVLPAEVLRLLARANILGGVVGWGLLIAIWRSFDPEGRWILGAAADSFIAIGLAEMLALRKWEASGEERDRAR